MKKASQKSLPVLGLSILSLSSLAAFFEFKIFPFERIRSNTVLSQPLPGASEENALTRAGLYGQGATIWAADGVAVHEVFEEAKGVAAEALEKTEVLRSQRWETSISEQEWRQLAGLWQSAADKLAVVVAYETEIVEPGMAEQADALKLDELKTDELKTYYHDYSNRQDLTLAIGAYQKSVFMAEQLDPNDATVCDAQTRLSNSPEKWEMVVALRQQSVDALKAVARNVSFYDEQVAPLMDHYQSELKAATRMHQRSPWYYAIQKAVCATQWGERAKVSGERSDWMQSAAFWAEGIALLESAPKRIPTEIPNQYRESYQAARGNLALWKENLKDAEMRAVNADF